MLRQTAILTAIAGLIKSKYSHKIYTDEIVEGFKQPCFFIKLVRRTDSQTVNFNSNNLSIIITFFASPSTNKEIACLDMTDDLNLLFGNGFKADDRFLHVKNFTSERIGENQDILQVTITIDYFDGLVRIEPEWMMEELVLNQKLIAKE